MFLRREKILNRRGHVVERSVIACINCGCEVLCADFTNTCDNCGTDYNMSGHLLAPREQWGEETGEHWSDIAMITGYED